MGLINYTSGNSDASDSLDCTAFPVTAGNFIAVGVRSAGTINSVTDTAGNTYVAVGASTSEGSIGNMRVFYAKNITGHAANVISVSFTGGNFSGAVAQQHSGLDITSPFDTYSTKSISTNQFSATSDSFNTSARGTILCFATQNASPVYTSGSDFVLAGVSSSNVIVGQYRMTTAGITGTTPSISSSVSAKWILWSVSFIASATPTITTDSVTSIGLESATGGGSIPVTAETVTERGLVWNTSPSPTTSNFKSVVAGTTGSFTAPLSGLTPGNTYYVRAYATTFFGSEYGNEVSFITSAVADNTISLDINGVEGSTYAVQMYVGGATGSVTVRLGTTGTSQVINAGAGTTAFQGTYGGLNGLIIEASGTFDGYVDNVYYVLVLGAATIDWSLDTLTNIFPINSSVAFKRFEEKDFNSFRVYRYLDIQFKDLDAYVTVLLKNESNENSSSISKQFLVSNTSTEVLPFIKKKLSMLVKDQAIIVSVSNNRVDETFTICQFILKGYGRPAREFDGGKIVNVV